jgi:hypothetical protein
MEVEHPWFVSQFEKLPSDLFPYPESTSVEGEGSESCNSEESQE